MERTDRREKFFAYTGIESSEEYVLVAQEAREVTVFRRSSGWAAEKYSNLDAAAAFRAVQCETPLSAIYEGL